MNDPHPGRQDHEPAASVPPADTPPRLRPGTLADLDGLADLERVCFGRDAWSRESVRRELADQTGDRVVLVAEADDQTVAGFAVLWVSGSVADLPRLAVHRRHRRRGLGRRLLAALMERARRQGCTEMLLEVRAGNRIAVNLYRTFGFEVIARRRGYYRAGGVSPAEGREGREDTDTGSADALVLRKELRVP